MGGATLCLSTLRAPEEPSAGRQHFAGNLSRGRRSSGFMPPPKQEEREIIDPKIEKHTYIYTYIYIFIFTFIFVFISMYLYCICICLCIYFFLFTSSFTNTFAYTLFEKTFTNPPLRTHLYEHLARGASRDAWNPGSQNPAAAHPAMHRTRMRKDVRERCS